MITGQKRIILVETLSAVLTDIAAFADMQICGLAERDILDSLPAVIMDSVGLIAAAGTCVLLSGQFQIHMKFV